MSSYVQMTAVAVNAPVTAAWANIIQGNLNYLADGNANILVITSGTGTITIPAGVTKIYPFAKGGCGGGGGGGGGLGGGGGGGGGGIMDNTGITVVAGDVLSYSIGVGGVAGPTALGGGNGGATTFTLHGVTHTAPGGSGGTGSGSGGSGGSAGNNFASNGINGTAGAGGTGGGSIGGDMSGGHGGSPVNVGTTAGQNGFLIIRYSPVSQGIGAASQTLDLTSANQLGEITSSEIIITGTWSGTRYVDLPSGILSRNGHIIKNNSTGASAVAIVRTSGGTGVTFDSTTQGGKTTLVYSDGTNTYDADSAGKYAPALLFEALPSQPSPTYNSVQELHNIVNPAGIISGGVCSYSGTTATFRFTACSILIRATNSDTATLYPYDIAQTDILIAAGDYGKPVYIYADYNAGTPILVQSLVDPVTTANRNSKVFMGAIYWDSLTNYHFTQVPAQRVTAQISNISNNLGQTLGRMRLNNVGAEIAALASLGFSITDANWAYNGNQFTTAAFNTATGSIFTQYSYSPTSTPQWTDAAGKTAINNTQWNDITTGGDGLVNITIGWYANRYLYLCDDGHVAEVIGRAQYSTLAGAQAEAYPTTAQLPPEVAGMHGNLNYFYRVTMLRNAATFAALATINAVYGVIAQSSTAADSVVTIDINNADYALTAADLLNKQFLITSTAALTANRKITVPDGTQKIFSIKNNINSTFTITIDYVTTGPNLVLSTTSGTTQDVLANGVGIYDANSRKANLDTTNTFLAAQTHNAEIIQPNAGLVWIRGNPATEAAERGYFDTHVNVLNVKSVTATYAAGVMTYTVAAGHGLASGTTTDRVTVRGFDQADYNVTKSVYTYISATQFSVTTAGTPVSPATGTGLCYPLNLFENFYTFNVAVDLATGIFAGRDITNFVRLLGTTEAGDEKEYYHASAAAGTVPTWGASALKVLNGAYYWLARTFAQLGNMQPFAANTYSIGTSALYWLNIFTKLIEFTSATLGAITAGRVEYDGTDLWFSESATVRSPLNNTKYQINAQVGTTYSFVIGDKGKLVTFNNAAAITATVEPDATTNYPIGTIIRVAQDGAGKLTIAAGAGVTINSLAGNKAMAGQYSDGTLVKEAANTWYLFGILIA